MKKRQMKIKDGGLIELLGDGQQTLLCGTHPSGVRYQWKNGLPEQIPTLSTAAVNSVWATLTQTYATTSSTQKTPTALARGSNPGAGTPSTGIPGLPTEPPRSQIPDPEWDQLILALRFLAPHSADEQTWAEIGMALLSIKDCGKPVRQLWLDFSKKAPNWQEGAAEAWWTAHAN